MILFSIGYGEIPGSFLDNESPTKCCSSIRFDPLSLRALPDTLICQLSPKHQAKSGMGTASNGTTTRKSLPLTMRLM